MKIKLDVNRLVPGMFVAELDRPWLGTPFLFQGFLIEGAQELEQLRDCCRQVFVDDLRSSPDPQIQNCIHSQISLSGRMVKPLTVEFEEWKGGARLRQSLKHLNTMQEHSRGKVANLLEDVRLGRSLPTEQTRRVVSDMVETVASNPKTAMWLATLRSEHEQIASHCMNVSVLAVSFARFLEYSPEGLQIVGEAGLLHDSGMAKVPDWIINKPGSLTRQEFELVRKHADYAARLMQECGEYDPRVIEIVRHHHERIDGSGYPSGLRGHEVPQYAQVVAIADIYESITTDKPYKKALPPSTALTRLHRRAGTHFDKQLVESFIRCVGIYPLGSLVKLVNGSLGVVISSQEENRLKPIMLIIRDHEGKTTLPRKIVNLALLEEQGIGANWKIDSMVEPDDHGVDVQQILIEEFRLR